MLGKTHIAVGCAIYFCVAQPTDFKSLFAGVAISIIGSEVSDIDEANSKVGRVFSWLLVGIVLLAAAATFIKNQFELTLTLPTCISTSKNLFTLFLLVLLFGYFSHHRNGICREYVLSIHYEIFIFVRRNGKWTSVNISV